jgi:hypothetical protein
MERPLPSKLVAEYLGSLLLAALVVDPAPAWGSIP